MSDAELIVEKERGRTRIIFNRPERHNAVDGSMSRALHETLVGRLIDP